MRDRKSLIFSKLEEKFSNVTVTSNTNQVCSRQSDGLPGCVWEGYMQKQEGVGANGGWQVALTWIGRDIVDKNENY